MTDIPQTRAPATALRRRLAGHLPTFLMSIRAWPQPEAVHLAANTGHHGIYVDMQHGALSVESASRLCLVAHAMGLPALVRTPSIDRPLIGNVLDNGAAGIMVPDVESAASARQAVEAACYPPAGLRSKGGQRGYAVESTPFIVVMIESRKGVAAAAEIAAVRGVDAVMVGMGDLSASMGVKATDAACIDMVKAVVAAGKAASRPVIIAGLRDAAACGQMAALGASPFFILGTDISYLLDGAGRQVANFHAVFGDNPA